MNILNRVMEIASKELEIPIEQVFPELSINTVESWDSLGHLNLILAIEEEFDVKFLTEEIPNLSSIKIITETVKKKIKMHRSNK